ncbi:hypothetical protein BFL43_03670 [Williamsia sp. 1135]|nr:hypothetical protein BFL43_03670 [Williamsia sp. 1135]
MHALRRRPVVEPDWPDSDPVTIPEFPAFPGSLWAAQTDVLERIDISSPRWDSPTDVFDRIDESTPATGKQAAWNYLVFALSKSSTLIMTIILARLLNPEEFGLFAFALLVVNLFDFVKDLGVGASLVQSRRSWARIAPTGLTLSVVFGVLIGGALAATAGLTSRLVGHPDLEPLIQVLAIGLTISALSVVPMASLRRKIDFKGRIFPEFVGALLKTVLTVGLAVGGLGVWSLIWGQLLGVTVTMLLYWRVAGASLKFGYDGETARALLKFGLPVTAVTLLAFGIYNIDYLAVGTRLGDAELGLYTLAYRVPELLVLSLCGVISEVLFSSLSRLQHDLPSLGKHYLQTLGVVVALTAPIGIGLAVGADALIATMYGPSYAAAGPMLAVLALYAVIYSASFHSGDVYKAIGRPSVLTAINAGKFAALIVPIWWAAGHSAVMVAVVLLGVELVHFAVRMRVVHRVLTLSWAELLVTIARPLSAAVVMGAVLLGVNHLCRDLPAPALLAVLAMAGLAVYIVVVRFTAPEMFAMVSGPVLRKLGREPAPIPADPSPADLSPADLKPVAPEPLAPVAMSPMPVSPMPASSAAATVGGSGGRHHAGPGRRLVVPAGTTGGGGRHRAVPVSQPQPFLMSNSREPRPSAMSDSRGRHRHVSQTGGNK